MQHVDQFVEHCRNGGGSLYRPIFNGSFTRFAVLRLLTDPQMTF